MGDAGFISSTVVLSECSPKRTNSDMLRKPLLNLVARGLRVVLCHGQKALFSGRSGLR